MGAAICIKLVLSRFRKDLWEKGLYLIFILDGHNPHPNQNIKQRFSSPLSFSASASKNLPIIQQKHSFHHSNAYFSWQKKIFFLIEIFALYKALLVPSLVWGIKSSDILSLGYAILLSLTFLSGKIITKPALLFLGLLWGAYEIEWLHAVCNCKAVVCRN